jgi:foldase protein PrsA
MVVIGALLFAATREAAPNLGAASLIDLKPLVLGACRMSCLPCALALIAVVSSPVDTAADDRLVVTVNGDPVLQDQVIAECDNRLNQTRAREAVRGLALDESARELARDSIRAEVIHALIERRLIAQQLARDGVTITDAEVDEAFRAKAAAIGQTPVQAAEEIAAQGRTLDAVKDRIRWSVLGVQRLYDLHAKSKPTFTEQDARHIYDEYPGEFDLEERRRVSHILLRWNERSNGSAQSSATQKAAARVEADQLLARLRRGEDFASLARASSDDAATRSLGGDRGYSTRGIIVDESSDPFGNAAFALQAIGDVSEVIESNDGFHIIKLTDLQPARRQPFAEVKQRLLDDYHYREVARFWEDFGGKLHRSATLEWSPAEARRQAEARERQRRFNEHVERLIAREEKHAVEPPPRAAAESPPASEPLFPDGLIPPSRSR